MFWLLVLAYFPFSKGGTIDELTQRGDASGKKLRKRTIGDRWRFKFLASPTRLNHENVTRGTRIRSRGESTTSETLRGIRIVGSQRDIEAVPCGARRGATALSSWAFTGVIIIVIWRLLFFRRLDLMDGSVITRFSTFVSVDNESQ